MIDRRTFVRCLASLGAGVLAGARALAEHAMDRGPVPLSAIRIDYKKLDGTLIKSYNGSDAKPLGTGLADMVSYKQQQAFIFDASNSMWFHFRPDTTSSRVEIVFEYCNIFKPLVFAATAPQTLVPEPSAAYMVDIVINGAVVATHSVPAHFWATGWRWQSSQRPIIHSIASLLAANKLPRYRRLHPRMAIPKPAPPYDGPMGTSDIYKSMGDTGERKDIGFLPERDAAAIATGDAAMIQSTFDWAEACQSIACIFRDPASGMPVDMNKYPMLTTYYDYSYSKPQMNCKSATPFKFDTDHHPQLGFLAFQLTNDYRYLEMMQFYSNLSLMWVPNKNHLFTDAGTTRGVAWTRRTYFCLSKAMEDFPAPSGLLPRTHWDNILALNLKALTKQIHKPGRVQSVFFSGLEDNTKFLPWWQEDYNGITDGFGVQMGFTEWLPILRWKVKSNINRTNGTSGWHRGDNTIYHPIYKDAAGNIAADWPALFALNPKLADASNDHIDWTTGTYGQGPDYLNGCRAVLALASYPDVGNVPEALPCLAWMDAEFAAKPHWPTWRTAA